MPSNLAMPESPKVLDDVNGLNADNLRLISEKDPHPEVRRAAENMYQGYLDREADPEGREGKLK